MKSFKIKVFSGKINTLYYIATDLNGFLKYPNESLFSKAFCFFQTFHELILCFANELMFLRAQFYLWLYTKRNKQYLYIWLGFPDGSEVKNPPANAGDTGSISESGDPLEEK